MIYYGQKMREGKGRGNGHPKTKNKERTTTMKTKTTKKNTKATKKTAPKYTRLTVENIGEIIAEATTELVSDAYLADDISDTFEIEEYDEAAGTYFIIYAAEDERAARIFNAAIIGTASVMGYFAEPSERWEDEHDADNGRRAVSVFVAAADFMGEDGHAVA